MSTGSVPIRTLRGALAGALAASVWALEQPLDKLLLSSRYDDVELLGRAVRNGPGWYRVGLVLHIQNGAMFGAVYANVAPTLPLAHLAGWPLVALTDRFHPARNNLPALGGNHRAFVQATWRHLLFGIVLGELERRMNPPPESAPDPPTPNYASNGHGSLDRAVSTVQD